MSWAKLRGEYRRRGVVLGLGAGVSVGSGLPSWPLLVRRLTNSDPRLATSYRELRCAGLSLPSIAGLVAANHGSEDKFLEHVRDALYKDFPFRLRAPVTRNELVQHVETKNATLRAIAAFCAISSDAGNYHPNPRIKAIVNYNLDSVLTKYVRLRYGRPLLRTIERAAASASRWRIPAYHVHGFLRFDEHAGDPQKESSRIVLTEADYYDAFNDPTSVFTYTLLYIMRESAILFLGLSMSDNNLRRLLHYSLSERRASYLAKRSAVQDRKITRHFAALERPESREQADAVEQSLKGLGVTVAWYDNHRDLPEHLGTVYAAGGDDWKRVYGAEHM